ncbi:MAG: ribosomal protein [Actinomycetota bacterium]|jgi:large subunit ribosomal protein L30
MSKLQVTQIKSTIGEKPAARETMRSLGLKRIGHVVIKEDRPEIRGMVKSIQHLISVEEVK